MIVRIGGNGADAVWPLLSSHGALNSFCEACAWCPMWVPLSLMFRPGTPMSGNFCCLKMES